MEREDVKILIVDDLTYIRMQLKKLLRDMGFSSIQEASDGIEALEKFKEFVPTVVLLDLTLPKISGFDLLKIFLQLHKDTKVMVVSSNEDINVEHDVLKRGALAFLQKPVEDSLFRKKMEDLINEEARIKHDDVHDLVIKHNDYSEKIGIKLNANKSVQVLNVYGVLKDEDLDDVYKTVSSLIIYHHNNVILNLNGVTKMDADVNRLINIKNLVEQHQGKFIIILLKQDIIELISGLGLEDYIVKTESQALNKL